MWYVDLEKKHARPRGHRHLRRARSTPSIPLVARQPVARLHQAAPEPSACRFRLLPRAGQDFQVTDGMSDALRSLRQRRQVPLLHRQHRHRPEHRLARYVQPAAPRHAQRLCDGAEEGPAFAAGARRATRRRRPEPENRATRTSRPTKTKTRRRPRRRSRPRSRSTSRTSASASSALPIPARQLRRRSQRARPGVVFLVEGPAVDPIAFEEGAPAAHRPQVRSQDAQDGEDPRWHHAFDLSFNGEKMLYRGKDQWTIARAEKPSDGPAEARPGRSR